MREALNVEYMVAMLDPWPSGERTPQMVLQTESGSSRGHNHALTGLFVSSLLDSGTQETHFLLHRFRANMQHITRFQGLSPESQNVNLALTVQYAPFSPPSAFRPALLYVYASEFRGGGGAGFGDCEQCNPVSVRGLRVTVSGVRFTVLGLTINA